MDEQNWYQEQYAKIAIEADLSTDAPAEDVLEELTEGIEYVAKCAIREDLINLLDDNEAAIAVVKDYFKDLMIIDNESDNEPYQMTGDEKFGIELAVALAESGDTVYRKDGVTLTPDDVKAVDWQVV